MQGARRQAAPQAAAGAVAAAWASLRAALAATALTTTFRNGSTRCGGRRKLHTRVASPHELPWGLCTWSLQHSGYQIFIAALSMAWLCAKHTLLMECNASGTVPLLEWCSGPVRDHQASLGDFDLHVDSALCPFHPQLTLERPQNPVSASACLVMRSGSPVRLLGVPHVGTAAECNVDLDVIDRKVDSLCSAAAMATCMHSRQQVFVRNIAGAGTDWGIQFCSEVHSLQRYICSYR